MKRAAPPLHISIFLKSTRAAPVKLLRFSSPITPNKWPIIQPATSHVEICPFIFSRALHAEGPSGEPRTGGRRGEASGRVDVLQGGRVFEERVRGCTDANSSKGGVNDQLACVQPPPSHANNV